MRSHRPIFVFLTIITGLILLFAVFMISPARAIRSRCIENLRVVEWAKHCWMVDNHKSQGDIPNWNDLSEELARHGINGIPKCPDGGTYSIGRLGEPPTCSLGGVNHSVP